MKKSVIISIALAAVAVSAGAVVVLLNAGKTENASAMYGGIDQGSSYPESVVSEFSETSGATNYVSDTLAESTPEGQMRKQISDEYMKFYQEEYDKLDDSSYNPLIGTERKIDAQQRASNRQYELAHAVIEKYTGYKIDPSDTRREVINEVIEKACYILNETPDITLEERTRLTMYLEDMYYSIKSGSETTDRDRQDMSLIESTIRLPY